MAVMNVQGKREKFEHHGRYAAFDDEMYQRADDVHFRLYRLVFLAEMQYVKTTKGPLPLGQQSFNFRYETNLCSCQLPDSIRP